MTAQLVTARPELAGNGTSGGYQKARTYLGVPPAGFTKWRFFYRSWITGPPTVAQDNLDSHSYDNTWCFGLSSDGLFPEEGLITDLSGYARQPLSNFFGQCNEGWRGVGTSWPTNRERFYYRTAQHGADWFWGATGPRLGGGSWYNNRLLFYKQQTELFDIDSADLDFATITDAEHMIIPNGATSGAKFSAMWEAEKSQVDNSVAYRLRTTMASVDRESLEDTESAAVLGSEKTGSLQGDSTDTFWVDAAGALKFPPYLLMRYPGSSHTWRLDQYKVEFYSPNDDLLGVLPS